MSKPISAPTIDTRLISNLFADQFPYWAHLPLVPVASAGTDNAIFRLGEDMAVRLPKVDWAVGQAEKESVWLPRLAPHLPLEVPVPLALGKPAFGYPWHWAVCRWLPGNAAIPAYVADSRAAASAVAEFILALQRIDASDGPRAGRQNHYRGLPLAALDGRVRGALGELDGRIDVRAATRAWDLAVAAPVWSGDPVWLHGDLHANNMLTTGGRLSAVIDFGLLGVGDPATDMMVAWMMFDVDARTVFRATVQADDGAWARALGWALYSSVIALPFYWDSNPLLVAGCLRTLAQVLSETEVG